MSSNATKHELIEWLKKLENKSILTSLLQFKKYAEKGDWTDNLTPEQLEVCSVGWLI